MAQAPAVAPKFDLNLTNPRVQTEYEEHIVAESLREFSQMQTWRNTFASHWEETAELILPTSRNTFYFGDFNWPGQKKTDRQIDSTGMVALSRWTAICDSLMTPYNMQWHGLRADDDYVWKDRATQLWFEAATKKLFHERYKGPAGFSQANTSDWTELGAFGNAGLLMDAVDPVMSYGEPGLRYHHIPMGGLFFHENHQHIVDGFVYWFKMTARQCLQRYGEENFPAQLIPALNMNSEMLYDFIMRVCPREDYDPERVDHKGMKWASYHIFMPGRVLVRESGYRTFPMAISRYMQTPGEVYGRGPAQLVLPTLKTINAMKATYLKQVHRNADPVLLTIDDGVVGMNLRPGSMNKGGLDAAGHELVKTLPTGNVQVAKEMLDGEASLINDVFLVSLFQILMKTPQMSATEVIERMNEKGILVAPTLQRQWSERMETQIHRELDLLMQQGLLPPMPPRLKEAQGRYRIIQSSPLARVARSQEVAGFLRTVEIAKELVSVTGDTSLLDPFAFNRALPDIAELQGVVPSWMSSKQEIANKQVIRAKSIAAKQAVDAMPAQAAMIKAKAVALKAGQGQPSVAPIGPAQQPAQPGPPLTEPQP